MVGLNDSRLARAGGLRSPGTTTEGDTTAMPTTRHDFDRWLTGETLVEYDDRLVDDEPEPFYCAVCDCDTLDRLAHAHDDRRTIDVATLRLTYGRSRDVLTALPGIVTVPVGSGFDEIAAAVLDLLVDSLNGWDTLPGRPADSPVNVRGTWYATARVVGGIVGQFVRYDAILTARRRRPLRCRFTVRGAQVREVAR